MKFTKAMLFVFSVFAISLFLLPQAGADQWNKKTIVTFNHPVEVPGVGVHILPAGTYVFKLVDSLADRNIVRIFNEDETEVLTTILAISNYRLHATDETVLSFRERAEGSPQALRAWFYPGETWGHEFVYPKTRATELARITHEPVLATPAELGNAPIDTFKTVPVEAIEPTGEVVEQAKVVEAPPVVKPPAEVLPQTASSLPLIGLSGLLALGGGLAVLLVRKRVDSSKRAYAASTD